ncbi:MAG: nuclear transport factor 2 family protein [Eudoraea sp.]|nr:nuclear transport factor 2 family protein [Eudoraea sp.]
MKFSYSIVILPLLILTSCSSGPSEATIEGWKNEIVETEQDFSDLARKDGIPKAFLTYAAEDAVLMRNNSLVIGKTAIKQQFKSQEASGNTASLSWKPDFVDVSTSGDLGFTYGKYKFVTKDSLGQPITSEGVFHTVWKRQADGNWRFVWD